MLVEHKPAEENIGYEQKTVELKLGLLNQFAKFGTGANENGSSYLSTYVDDLESGDRLDQAKSEKAFREQLGHFIETAAATTRNGNHGYKLVNETVTLIRQSFACEDERADYIRGLVQS